MHHRGARTAESGAPAAQRARRRATMATASAQACGRGHHGDDGRGEARRGCYFFAWSKRRGRACSKRAPPRLQQCAPPLTVVRESAAAKQRQARVRFLEQARAAVQRLTVAAREAVHKAHSRPHSCRSCLDVNRSAASGSRDSDHCSAQQPLVAARMEALPPVLGGGARRDAPGDDGAPAGLPSLRVTAAAPPATMDGPCLRVRAPSGSVSGLAGTKGGSGGGGGGGGGAPLDDDAHPHAPSPHDKNSFFTPDPVPSPPAFNLDTDAEAPPPRPPPTRAALGGSRAQLSFGDPGSRARGEPPPPRGALGRRAAGEPPKQRRGVSFSTALEARACGRPLRARVTPEGRHTAGADA